MSLSADEFTPAPLPVIRRLSEQLVNRIAAGEVIERPAAALKELVENAIDAGAGRIAVALDGGGIERIAVTDDGSGMAPEALRLAIERHCTSKLNDETLVAIASLGFRGEALPSIGAAARLCVTSRPHGAPEAWQLRVEGGRVGELAPGAGPPGTRVLVEDLFFATPARRKFLKSSRIEAAHAETALRRLALAAPHIAFSLEQDGRTLLDLPASDRRRRVEALLGEDGAQGLLVVQGARDGMQLEGFACGPAVHRPTASGQFLVVNGRPVTDPMLRTAVRVAYRHAIVAGRHPVLALFLTIPPERLDVNVHPAKTELRFADEQAVRSLVIGSLGRALSTGAGQAGVAVSLPARASGPNRIWYPAEPVSPGAGFAEPRLAIAGLPQSRTFDDPGRPVAPAPPSASSPALPASLVAAAAIDGHATPPVAENPLGASVAQVLDTYVIAVASDGSLVLVDQHAAHERLTHEHLRTLYMQGGIAAQRLLLPAVADLPLGAAGLLLSHAGTLARLGVEIEAFGGTAILVRALPALLGAPDPVALLRDLADELATGPFGDSDPEASAEIGGAIHEGLLAGSLGAAVDSVLARLACHGSIRAGRRLGRAEMDALLRRMEATPGASTCSHGRPTYLKLSRHEIERLFGRA